MATKSTCDVKGLLNDAQASCVKSHVAGLIPVEYEIHFDKAMRLPYAVNWNGEKQPSSRVAMTSGEAVATVRIMARSGEKVGLYLGSDASPQFRQEILFPITVGHKDIRVVIHDKEGLQDHVAEVSMDERHIQRDVQEAGRADRVDIYKGNFLTGDVWMQCSHPYTVAQALAIAAEAAESDDGVLAALHAMYGGKVSKAAGYTVAFAGKHRCKISFQNDVDGNCVKNIKRYLSLGGFDGVAMPRVHPRSWIALLQAARDAHVGALEITSGWRPRQGAAPHRIGLGLDVKSAQSVGGAQVVFDKNSANLWSSPEEKQAHGEWVAAEAELAKANVALAEAQRALEVASDEGRGLAERRASDATSRVEDAVAARGNAKGKYQRKHAGSIADTFEKALAKNPLIRQVFEPLVMDANTHDKLEPEVNQFRSSNEVTHANHLHVTAADVYLTY